MSTEQFLYWLDGFAGLSHTPPTVEQWGVIRSQLKATLEAPVMDRQRLQMQHDLNMANLAHTAMMLRQAHGEEPAPQRDNCGQP